MTRAISRLAKVVAIAVSLGLAAPPDTRLLEMDAEAVRLLRRAADAAAAGDRTESGRLLKEAAQQVQALAGESALPADLRRELERAAAGLRGQAAEPPRMLSLDAALRLLERVSARLTSTTTTLPFQGSYSQPKVAEPAYGGHASAMGPPPENPSARGGPSPVQFE